MDHHSSLPPMVVVEGAITMDEAIEEARRAGFKAVDPDPEQFPLEEAAD